MKQYFFSLITLLLIHTSVHAKYEYTLRWDKPNTHTFNIEMRTEPQQENYTDIQIATWRPGRYINQDYAAAVFNFQAKDANGNVLTFRKIDKSTWRVNHGKIGKLVINYAYYANNDDAGSSLFTEGQVYFNPINCFMYVPGRLLDPVTLSIPDLPSDFKAATALEASKEPNVYMAASFHEFADCPSVFAKKMKTLSFNAQNATFRLHFQGDYQGDVKVDSAIIQNIRKIVNEQGAIFGGSFPFREYHFIYRLLDYDLRHAVEHTNSTSLALPASVTKSVDRVAGGICGISSHEFFHAWNVKRIRPAALFPYDYHQEQYTGLHWFTEGITEYYSLLAMTRAGVVSQADGYRLLSNVLQGVDNNYAYSIVAPYYSSYDSWLAPSTYAHPFHKTSFYSSGERLGFLVDMKIRVLTGGKKSLDDVFRYMLKEYHEKNIGVPEDGVQKAIEVVTGSSWQSFFEKYVYSPEKPDYNAILKGSGVMLEAKDNPTAVWEKLGIQQQEQSEQGWFLKKMHVGGDVFKAGIGLGDLITRINGQKPSEFKEADFFAKLKKGDKITMEYITGADLIKTVSFAYTENCTPQVYTLKADPAATPAEAKIREDWLKSQVK